MKILHLSDTHLASGGRLHRTGVDAAEALAALLAELEPLRDLAAVVVTGDVADDGAAEAYAKARDMIGAYARGRGAPLVFTTGNTDDRDAFAEVLGSGHLDDGGRAAAVVESPGPERAAASMLGGLRLVTLDSLVPGEVHGLIGGAQFGWLRDVLAEPAPDGTVLAFHHPPIRHPNAVQEPPTLLNPDELVAAIVGTDVHTILCGHYHLQLAGRAGQAAVSVGPGVVNRRDLSCGDEAIRYVRGSGASLADFTDPAAPVFHTMQVRDAKAGETLFELGGEELRRALGEPGPGER